MEIKNHNKKMNEKILENELTRNMRNMLNKII